jgi:hypothetical protein
LYEEFLSISNLYIGDCKKLLFNIEKEVSVEDIKKLEKLRKKCLLEVMG